MSLQDTITEFANKLARSQVNHVDLNSPVQITRLGLAFVEVAMSDDGERAATEDRLIAQLESEFAPH